MLKVVSPILPPPLHVIWKDKVFEVGNYVLFSPCFPHFPSLFIKASDWPYAPCLRKGCNRVLFLTPSVVLSCEAVGQSATWNLPLKLAASRWGPYLTSSSFQNKAFGLSPTAWKERAVKLMFSLLLVWEWGFHQCVARDPLNHSWMCSLVGNIYHWLYEVYMSIFSWISLFILV